jgi:hypothetical protein
MKITKQDLIKWVDDVMNSHSSTNLVSSLETYLQTMKHRITLQDVVFSVFPTITREQHTILSQIENHDFSKGAYIDKTVFDVRQKGITSVRLLIALYYSYFKNLDVVIVCDDYHIQHNKEKMLGRFMEQLGIDLVKTNIKFVSVLNTKIYTMKYDILIDDTYNGSFVR